ncbi:alpha,alpha-trehalase nth1 [Stygiomarasmius scandens]|uniref:Endonuclease III homolog n=1 Tax=Marasmiellus scandens TaxID=2682957 RepID=A0ABR1ITB0_9AGAR
MSGIKRSVSTRSSARLTAMISHANPHNPAVTLFELNSSATASESATPDRPAKRVKFSKEEISDEDEPLSELSDDPYTPEPGPSKLTPKDSARSRKTPKKSEGKAPAKAKSPKKPKPIPTALETPHPAPDNWKVVYDKIKEMRSKVTAPVDTMGCDQAQRGETDPRCRRLSTLVSLMLSSQTKDEVTDAAVSQLRTALGGSITVAAIIDAEDSTISGAIGKVGFWRRKTQYIKQTAIQLRDNHDSDVPKTVDELCALPGVGPKMAFLALQRAWNLNHGIGVDVHVHRISNRLGWHKPSTKTPEETRLNLQSWLPKELHADINHLLVGFGQTICAPVRPKCEQCTLSSDGLCPSAQVVKPKVSKSKSKATKMVKNAKIVQKDADKEEVEDADAKPKIEIAFEEEEVKSRVKAVATLGDGVASVDLSSAIKFEEEE